MKSRFCSYEDILLVLGEIRITGQAASTSQTMKAASHPLIKTVVVAGGLSPVPTMVAVCSVAIPMSLSYAAVSAFFKVGDLACFGMSGKSHVLRGHTDRGSSALIANNDGPMLGTEG